MIKRVPDITFTDSKKNEIPFFLKFRKEKDKKNKLEVFFKFFIMDSL